MFIVKIVVLKIYNAVLASPFLATVALFFEPLRKLVNDELSFFGLLFMAITIDLIIGMIKYWKLETFNFKKLVTGLMIKVLVAYGGLLLFLAFKTLDSGIIAEWFGLMAKFIVLLYPTGSALSNMFIITGGKFPPIGFMKKLEDFEKITEATLSHSNKVVEDNVKNQ